MQTSMELLEKSYDYSGSIRYFEEKGRMIAGVYDLLVRGSSKDSTHCIAQWSDIDLSIIVEEINPGVLKQVRQLYREMINRYSFKISITTVTKKDFFSRKHHHGIKPLNYSFLLKNSVSLFNRDLECKREISREELRIDCLANVVYLMHDLRISDMKRGDDLVSLQLFCLHILKRSKHLVRNAIFVLTGHMGSDIHEELFQQCFPAVDPAFPRKLKNFKSSWDRIIKKPTQLQAIIEYVFQMTETIYAATIEAAEHLNFERVSP